MGNDDVKGSGGGRVASCGAPCLHDYMNIHTGGVRAKASWFSTCITIMFGKRCQSRDQVCHGPTIDDCSSTSPLMLQRYYDYTPVVGLNEKC